MREAWSNLIGLYVTTGEISLKFGKFNIFWINGRIKYGLRELFKAKQTI